MTDNTTSNHRWSETWIERVEFAIAVLIQLSIFSIAVAGIIDRQWLTAFTGFVVLLLSFAPAVLERRLRVRLPVEVLLLTCLFLYASFALGEVRDFYERVWWWDLLLHGSSATIIGLIGFLAIYVFYMTHRIRIAPLYFAIFAFGTAVTVGTLWEVFEYLMDIAFGLNMQRSGLNDTMTDLMINLAGAFAAATVGFYYVRHSDGLLGRNLIRKLVQRYRTRHDTATPRSS